MIIIWRKSRKPSPLPFPKRLPFPLATPPTGNRKPPPSSIGKNKRKNRPDSVKRKTNSKERIEILESRDAEIDALMARPDVCTNVAKLQELSKEKEGIQEELESLMERWEILESELS